MSLPANARSPKGLTKLKPSDQTTTIGLPSSKFARLLRILLRLPTPGRKIRSARPPPSRRPPLWAEVRGDVPKPNS